MVCERLRIVENADEEIVALRDIDPHVSALVDKRFAGELEALNIKDDPGHPLTWFPYYPDKMVYRSKAETEQLALFPEILSQRMGCNY